MKSYTMARDEDTLERETRIQEMLKHKLSYSPSVKKIYMQALAELEKRLLEEGYGHSEG